MQFFIFNSRILFAYAKNLEHYLKYFNYLLFNHNNSFLKWWSLNQNNSQKTFDIYFPIHTNKKYIKSYIFQTNLYLSSSFKENGSDLFNSRFILN
jgi:hypothetical protein